MTCRCPLLWRSPNIMHCLRRRWMSPRFRAAAITRVAVCRGDLATEPLHSAQQQFRCADHSDASRTAQPVGYVSIPLPSCRTVCLGVSGGGSGLPHDLPDEGKAIRQPRGAGGLPSSPAHHTCRMPVTPALPSSRDHTSAGNHNMAMVATAMAATPSMSPSVSRSNEGIIAALLQC